MNKFKLNPLEKSWILYDIANSAFVLLVSTLIPIYFNSLAESAGVDETRYLSLWGSATSLSAVIVAVLAPICGALSDRKFKKPFFMIAMLLGCSACVAMGFVTHWFLFLVIFVISQVGFHSSIVFYDSMLPEITTKNRMDNVSSMGYGYGYIGSVIPFVICLALVLCSDMIGISMGTAMTLAFLITAAWWLLLTLPLSRRYKQTAFVSKQHSAIGDAFRQLAKTFRDAKKEKHIFVYMLSFFFFINGVYTIISMATSYGSALDLDTTGLLLALLVTQIVAFPCAIFFGRVSQKRDLALLMKICILAYTAITVFAFFLSSLWQFWLLAVLVGMFQGGIQAMSRSYLGKIIPPERSGEFFGLMDICGKGASFLGAGMIALVNELAAGVEFSLFGMSLNNNNLAVGSLVILFIVGFILFCKADKLNKARQQ